MGCWIKIKKYLEDSQNYDIVKKRQEDKDKNVIWNT